VNVRFSRYAGYAAGVLLLLLLPRLVYPVLALDILLWGLFAIALDLLLGFAGLLSFGHAMFWGVAGYGAAISARAWQLPFPVAVLIGMLVSIGLAVPIGFLSVRRSGIYFAMVTLAFAQMVFFLINEWRDLTGGENGLQGVPRLLPLVDLHDPIVFYYAALPLILLGYWTAHRVVHSPFGRVLTAVRDNEVRAQALGYPTRRYKLMVFVISSALSGLAGSLQALGHGFATLEFVHWTTSGEVVIMTILGGIGTLWGSLAGAAIFLLLRDWLSTSAQSVSVPVVGDWLKALSEGPLVITGAIFIVIVLNFRHGVWGTLTRVLADPGSLTQRLRRRLKPAPE
jgi:branched-chain amino acid transport system permease protein